MNTEFVNIIQKLIAEQGKDVFLNASKCKAFLADYTRNEYKKESRLLLQVLQTGVGTAIDNTQELEICKKQQVRLLHEDYFIAEAAAIDIVDTICIIMEKKEQPKSLSCQQCGKELQPEWKICPYCGEILSTEKPPENMPSNTGGIKLKTLDDIFNDQKNKELRRIYGKNVYTDIVKKKMAELGITVSELKNSAVDYAQQGKTCQMKGQMQLAIDAFDKAFILDKTLEWVEKELIKLRGY